MATLLIGVPASGLDIFLRSNNTTLADPLSITYQIFEPAGSGVASGNGFRRSIGHYDARNSVIPSGYSTSSSWSIRWTFVSQAHVTSIATEEFSVADSMSGSFTNEQDLIEQIKLDLGLKDSEFTDAQYNIFIVKALNRINLMLCLSGDDALKLKDGAITPPVNEGGQALILLAIECLVQQRKRTISVGKGIRVRDGDSEIDTTAGFAGQKDLVENICGDFNKAIAHLLYTGCSIFDSKTDNAIGEIVWYGNSRIYENMDHDGDGTGITRDYSSPFDPGSLYWDIPRR